MPTRRADEAEAEAEQTGAQALGPMPYRTTCVHCGRVDASANYQSAQSLSDSNWSVQQYRLWPRVGEEGDDNNHPYAQHLSCAVCSVACDWCDENADPNELYSVRRLSPSGMDEVCANCQRDTTSCDGCDDRFNGDDVRYSDRHDAYFCSPCYDARDHSAPEDEDEENDRDGVILGYHSGHRRPQCAVTPWTRARSGRCVGIELEIETARGYDRHTTAERMLTAVQAVQGTYARVGRARLYGERMAERAYVPPNFGHIESDGSLHYGWELVTAPLDAPTHRYLWTRLLQAPTTKGMRSHQTVTCGLHVHVSRAGLTKATIAKIVTCMNSPAWERLVHGVARRYSTGYCLHKTRKLSRATALGHNYGTDRYELVNLQNDRTIEFRVFRGSLNPVAVLAAMEFSLALVDWARSTSCANLSPDHFLEYVGRKDNTSETQYLRHYLTERNVHSFPSVTLPTNEA